MMNTFEQEYHCYLMETYGEPTEQEMELMADYYEAMDSMNGGIHW